MMRRFSRRMFGSLLLSTLAVPAVQAAQRSASGTSLWSAQVAQGSPRL